MNENKYHHSARDAFNRLSNSDEYMLETSGIHQFYFEDIKSHSYVFYIRRNEHGSSVYLF